MEKENKTVVYFKQPNNGKKFTLAEVAENFLKEIEDDRITHIDDWQLIISTDSQRAKKVYTYATVVCLYKVGHGARYFYMKKNEKDRPSVLERMVKEVMCSIELAEQLKETPLVKLLSQERIIVDMDVSPKPQFKSHLAVSSVTAIAKGYGYNFRIKPESMASYVADRHCKNHGIA